MSAKGLGIGRWIILLFAISAAYSWFKNGIELRKAMYRPAPPSRVLSASDPNDRQYIQEPGRGHR